MGREDAETARPLLPEGDDFHLFDPTNGTAGAVADPTPDEDDLGAEYGRRVGKLAIGGIGGF